MPDSPHASRKGDHLDLCISGDVAYRETTTLLHEVTLIHQALPELSLDEIDLSVDVLGKRLRAPLVIAAMTGGHERALAINTDLASVAEELGIGFALGSQRPMLHGDTRGYLVREVAPTTLVLGNIGIVQARALATAALEDLVARAGVDALCVHLNPAMEVVQPEGDRDFRGGLDTLARLAEHLSVPVVAKETGHGLSRRAGQALARVGVRTVDTSGAGGTSWVAVETARAEAGQRALGERFREWGIPTAASLLQLRGLGLDLVATGGVQHGLDAARALALGASAVGIARPFLQAHARGGRAEVLRFARQCVDELRVACLLTGSRGVRDLASADRVLGPALERWWPPTEPSRH